MRAVTWDLPDPNRRDGEVASRDGGSLELDHLAEDRQPCHTQHRGRRGYLGAQPRRQHTVVLEQQVDVGGIDVEPDEVREEHNEVRLIPPVVYRVEEAAEAGPAG